MASFTSQTPHFFKIILHHTLIEGKLDLPKKFVKNNGGSLLYNKASLKLPSGAKWEVELKKSDGKVWFGRGWPEFVDFHSVKLGFFVVFRYEGNCSFNVIILDLTATEIDYPVNKRILHRRKNHNRGFFRRPPLLVPKSEVEEDDDDEDSVQILNGVSRKRRREKDEEAAYKTLREMKKMMRKNVSVAGKMKQQFTTPQRFTEEEEEGLESDYLRRQYNYRATNHGGGGGGRHCPETMRPEQPSRTPPQPLTENQERVLRRASSFKYATQNPSFMVTMRPSYIQTGNYLSLPRSFAERYLKESMDVKLELSDGRIWSVWCGVRWAFTRRRTELKAGWKRFAVDNKLKEGDFCVFELIRTIKVSFKVTIFRLPNN